MQASDLRLSTYQTRMWYAVAIRSLDVAAIDEDSVSQCMLKGMSHFLHGLWTSRCFGPMHEHDSS